MLQSKLIYIKVLNFSYWLLLGNIYFQSGTIEFYITKPFNKEKATSGNGTQVSFIVNNRDIVDKFHEIGLKAGGSSEGSGGERPEGSGVYYSYIRDLDGNKICAFTNNK